MTQAQSYIWWNHRRVEGWIEPEILILMSALAAKQREQGVRGGVAEIGVHHGRFFIGLHLLRRPDERSVAIDLFEDQAHNIDRSGMGDEATFRDNLRRFADGDSSVAVVSADSTTLGGADIQGFAGGLVRMFSVDGGHTPEIVEHDMNTAADSLVEGGIAIGDDVFNSQWPGAVEGTLAFLDSNDRLVPFAVGYNKVLFTHPSFADSYRQTVMDVAQRHLWNRKLSSLRGHSVAIVWRASPKVKGKRLAKRVLKRE